MWFFIDHRRQNFSGSEHKRSLFYFGTSSQYCMGRSSYWPKTLGQRNRLTLLASKSMTCSSSSNIPLLRSKVINLSFVDQELSNDVFNSTIRPPQRKLGSRLTELTVWFFGNPGKWWPMSWSVPGHVSWLSRSCFLAHIRRRQIREHTETVLESRGHSSRYCSIYPLTNV